MIRPPPRSTRNHTLFPYTTLFRSSHLYAQLRAHFGMIGLTRVKVPPYGNCLFEALICAMQQHLFIDSNGVVNKDKEGERSEEHTSELQSLMRISYAVFCLKKKKY